MVGGALEPLIPTARPRVCSDHVFGQKWNLQFAITPVIPKLVKGNLFGY